MISEAKQEKRKTVTEPVTLRVFDIVGGPLCVSASDGRRLYDKIAPLLRTGTPVVLSFKQVDVLIPAFLNAAVGQLYRKLSKNRKLLSVRNKEHEMAVDSFIKGKE